MDKKVIVFLVVAALCALATPVFAQSGYHVLKSFHPGR